MDKKKSGKQKEKNNLQYPAFPGFLDPNLLNLGNHGFFPSQQPLDSSQLLNPLLGLNSGYPMFNPAILQALSQGVDTNPMHPTADWQKHLLEQSMMPPMGYIPPELMFPGNGVDRMNADKFGESSKSSPKINGRHHPNEASGSPKPRHSKSRGTPPNDPYRQINGAFKNNDKYGFKSPTRSQENNFQPNNLNELMLQTEMMRQFEQQFLLQQMQQQQHRESPQQKSSTHSSNMKSSTDGNKLQEQLSQAIFQQLLLGQQNPFTNPDLFHPALLQNSSSAYDYKTKSQKERSSSRGTTDYSDHRVLNNDYSKTFSSPMKRETSKNEFVKDEPFFSNLYQQMQNNNDNKTNIKTEHNHNDRNSSPLLSGHGNRSSPSAAVSMDSASLKHLELFSQLPKNEKTKGLAMKRKYSDELNNDNAVKQSEKNQQENIFNPNIFDKNNSTAMFSSPKLLQENSMAFLDKAMKEIYGNTLLAQNNFISPTELTKVNEALVSSIATEMQKLEKQKQLLEDKLKRASKQEDSSDQSTSARNCSTPKEDTQILNGGSPSTSKITGANNASEEELLLPLKYGWQREVQFNEDGLDVFYITPEAEKIQTYQNLIKYLSTTKIPELKPQNFSFCSKLRIGKFFEKSLKSDELKELSNEEVEKKMNDMDDVLKEAVLKYVSDNKKNKSGQHRDEEEHSGIKYEERKEKVKQVKQINEEDILQKLRQHRLEKELQEEHDRQQLELLKQFKLEETLRKNKEKEQRRQQMMILREIENRKRLEERERKREELRMEKIVQRQRKTEQRHLAMEIARDLKMPVEDMSIIDPPKLPILESLQGTYEINDEEKQLSGAATADLLMAMEFVNTFKSVLQLKKNDIPSVQSVHQALLNDLDHVDSLVNIAIILLHQCLCDPGVPAPGPWLNCANGLKVTEVDVSKTNFSEVLRLVIWGRTGYKTDIAIRLETISFLCLTPDEKAQCLAFLVNELVCSQPVCREIDKNIETISVLRKDKWIVEGQIRQLKSAQERQDVIDITNNKSDSMSEKSFEKEEPSNNEELQKQMDKLSHEHRTCQDKMLSGAKSLRGVHLGQDRYARRYWILPCIGGVFVESVESGLWYEDNINVTYESDEDEALEESKREASTEEDDESSKENENKNCKEETSTCDKPLSNNFINEDECEETSTSLHETDEKTSENETQDVPMDLSKTRKTVIQSTLQAKDTHDSTTTTNSVTVKKEFNADFFAKYLSSTYGNHRDWPPLSVIDIGQKYWLANQNTPLQKFDSSLSTQVIANALVAAENSNLGCLDKVEFPVKAPDVLETPVKVPKNMQFGWWKINTEEDLKKVQDNLSFRGIREKHLHRMMGKHMHHCKLSINSSKLTNFSLISDEETSDEANKTYFTPVTEKQISEVVDKEMLVQIEDLWGKCLQSGIITEVLPYDMKPSMDAKLTHVVIQSDQMSDSTKYDMLNPVKHEDNSILGAAVNLTIKLELLISRNFLKPPLVRKGGATEFSNLPSLSEAGASDVAAGLRTWRNAVSSIMTSAQLAVCIDMLNTSIAWEKFETTNYMKADSPTKSRRKKLEKRQAALKPRDLSPSTPKKRKRDTKRKLKEQNKKDVEEEKDYLGNVAACDIITDEVAAKCVENITTVVNHDVELPPERPPLSPLPEVTEHEQDLPIDSSIENFDEDEVKRLKKIKKKRKKEKKKLKEEEERNDKKKDKQKKNKKMKMKSKHLKVCKQMLNELQSHEEATWFLFPVDCKVVPGYRKIIKKPIDFHTIELRLTKCKYKTKEEFVDDVNLVFSNCNIFNEDDSPIGRACHLLQDFFQNRWKKLNSKSSTTPAINQPQPEETVEIVVTNLS